MEKVPYLKLSRQTNSNKLKKNNFSLNSRENTSEEKFYSSNSHFHTTNGLNYYQNALRILKKDHSLSSFNKTVDNFNQTFDTKPVPHVVQNKKMIKISKNQYQQIQRGRNKQLQQNNPILSFVHPSHHPAHINHNAEIINQKSLQRPQSAVRILIPPPPSTTFHPPFKNQLQINQNNHHRSHILTHMPFQRLNKNFENEEENAKLYVSNKNDNKFLRQQKMMKQNISQTKLKLNNHRFDAPLYMQIRQCQKKLPQWHIIINKAQDFKENQQKERLLSELCQIKEKNIESGNKCLRDLNALLAQFDGPKEAKNSIVKKRMTLFENENERT